MTSLTTVKALGVDVGSATTKLVGVDESGELVYHALEDSDPRIEAQTERMVSEARAAVDGGAAPLVSTGYGRKLVNGVSRSITEITCHARGVHRASGSGGTLIDIGGQDSKVVIISGDGAVTDFTMNDKCAAGTGRFLENTAARLKIPISEMSDLAMSTDSEVPISSTCTVFAESEIISMIARGSPVEQIVRGLHRSLVQRVVALLRTTNLKPPVLLSGGVARSLAVRTFIEEAIGETVTVPDHPQLMGAYGAALSALSIGD